MNHETINEALSKIEDPDAFLLDHLLLPKSILLQLRDTHLFNSLVEEAIEDIDKLVAVLTRH